MQIYDLVQQGVVASVVAYKEVGYYTKWPINWLIYKDILLFMRVQQVQQVQQPVFQFCKMFLMELLLYRLFWRLLHYYTTTLHKIITKSTFCMTYFCVCSSPYITVPSNQCQKFVLFCPYHLTVFLTILYTFIASAQGGAAQAPCPPPEHARPQASLHHSNVWIVETIRIIPCE